jgi:hypothetical protein
MKAIKASDIEEVEEVLAGIESSAVLNSREIGYVRLCPSLSIST